MVEPCFQESIGFVARAMKNFGLEELHIVNPNVTLGDSGRMRGGHAQEVIDAIQAHRSLQEAIQGVDLSVGTTAQTSLSSANLLRRHVSPKELAEMLEPVEGTIALVFGREGTGLTNLELGMCDITMTIPAALEYPTLNLSHAAAIIFYELFTVNRDSFLEQMASEGVKKKILEFFGQSAAFAGNEEYKVGLAARALRNVLGRSAIRRREGNLLAGIMRKIALALQMDASILPDRTLQESARLESETSC